MSEDREYWQRQDEKKQEEEKFQRDEYFRQKRENDTNSARNDQAGSGNVGCPVALLMLIAPIGAGCAVLWFLIA
jgi:hypothetical protein